MSHAGVLEKRPPVRRLPDPAIFPTGRKTGVEASQGHPLEPDTRRKMEGVFQMDFGSVRIHSDPLAVESARSVEARAYTRGNDIFFGSGEYRPGTLEGAGLLEHELAHVAEQTKSASQVQAFIERQSLFNTNSDESLTRLSERAIEKTLAESEAPIRRFLDANVENVKILSLNAVVGLVQKRVPEAAAMASGNVASAVSGWAAEKNIVLPRISAVPGSAETLPPSPTEPKKPPGKLSPYSMGMVGLHFTVNPTSQPDIAKALAPFRDRGIQIDDKIIADVTSNREEGVRELEAFLRATGLAGDAHKVAEFLAGKLQEKSIAAEAQAQQPTPIESAQTEAEKLNEGVFGNKPPSFIQSTPIGASITINFDFPGTH